MKSFYLKQFYFIIKQYNRKLSLSITLLIIQQAQLFSLIFNKYVYAILNQDDNNSILQNFVSFFELFRLNQILDFIFGSDLAFHIFALTINGILILYILFKLLIFAQQKFRIWRDSKRQDLFHIGQYDQQFNKLSQNKNLKSFEILISFLFQVYSSVF